MNFDPYVREIHYYETDQMAVVHHSNYIRFFEEARVDFLKRNGIDFSALETEKGILFAVLDAQCSYKKSARLTDVLYFYITLKSFTGVRFTLDYDVRFADGTVCATGTTSIGFLNRSYMPISIKRLLPEVYQQFVRLYDSQKTA